MRLAFAGKIVCGNSSRNSSDGLNGAIHIGDVDVIDEIAEQKWGPVSVFLDGEKVAHGCSTSNTGWGYSSWTPVESDEWRVDDFDLIGLLEGHDGEIVTLIITDEDESKD